MSWIQTTYLIAEVIAIPLTGFLTRVLTLRWLFVTRSACSRLASIGCAVQRRLRCAAGLSGRAGLFRRRADSRRVLGGVPAVSNRGFTRSQPPSAAWSRCWRRPSGPWSAASSPRPGRGTWLFLINVVPGLVVASVTPFLLPRHKTDIEELRKLDVISLLLMAAALAALEIGLKQAPQGGWMSWSCAGLLLTSAIGLGIFVRRTAHAAHPVLRLAALKRRSFRARLRS